MNLGNPIIPAACALLGMVAPCAAGGSKSIIETPATSQSGPRWELGGGIGVRQSFGMTMGSGGGGLNGGFYDLAAARAALESQVGPFGADANRSYDDGFVNIGSDFNLTTHWGYDSAGQIRAASQEWVPSQPWDAPGTQSLYLTRRGEPGTDAVRESGEVDPEVFPYIELRRLWVLDGGRSEVGWMVGLSWIPASGRQNLNLNLNSPTVTDEYYLYGVIPPEAPYSGPPQPPGPLLDNRPHDRQWGDSAAGLTGLTRAKVEVDLYTLSLGGIWRWLPEEQSALKRMRLYGLDVQAGLSLNQAELRMKETTSLFDGEELLDVSSTRARKDKFLAGLYASVGATFDLNYKDWFFETQLRYDEVGDVRISAGKTWADVDLSGWSAKFGLMKTF